MTLFIFLLVDAGSYFHKIAIKTEPLWPRFSDDVNYTAHWIIAIALSRGRLKTNKHA